MALIDENHATVAENSRQFWEDELKNTRILFFEIDKIIYGLSHDHRKSYSMNTGQDVINVTKQDLPSLIDSRSKLKKQIEELEAKLGIVDTSPAFIQGVPGW